MPIRFKCPNEECPVSITVKDEHAGRTGKCPSCKSSVKVPAAAAMAAPVSAGVSARNSPPPEPEEEIPRAVPVEPEDEYDVEELPEDTVIDEEIPRPVAVKPSKSKVEKARSASPEPKPKKAKPKERDPADEDPVEDEAGEESPLNKTEWVVRKNEGLIRGKKFAAFYSSPQSTDPLATVWDATVGFLGFIKIDFFGIRPRLRLEIRTGSNKKGPLAFSMERIVPIFDIPLLPPKPARWEIRGPNKKLIGSILMTRAGPTLLKVVAKGSLFHDEHLLLDAEDEQIGMLAMERGKMGIPKRLVVQDNNENELGSVERQEQKHATELMEEAKKTGKSKVQWSVSVLGKGGEEWKGAIGKVHPGKVSDPLARALTAGVCVLKEVLVDEAFIRTKTKS
jgi:hypothetical protein